MIELYKPDVNDLWFRKRMMSDEQTMSYNHASGGTIAFPKNAGQTGMTDGSQTPMANVFIDISRRITLILEKPHIILMQKDRFTSRMLLFMLRIVERDMVVRDFCFYAKRQKRMV